MRRVRATPPSRQQHSSEQDVRAGMVGDMQVKPGARRADRSAREQHARAETRTSRQSLKSAPRAQCSARAW
eukprot:2109149-Alexandrium_andersonii.AAC.1